jgi:hypothetical protein
MAKNAKKTNEVEELSNSIADSTAKKLKLPSGAIDSAVFKELKRLVPAVMQGNKLQEQQIKNTETTNNLLSQHLKNTEDSGNNVKKSSKEQPEIKEEKSNPFAVLSKDLGMAGTAFQGIKNLVKTIPQSVDVAKLVEEATQNKSDLVANNQSGLQNLLGSSAPVKEKSELEAVDKPVKVEIVNLTELAKIIPEAMKESLKGLSEGIKKGSGGNNPNEDGDGDGDFNIYDLVAGTGLMKSVRGGLKKGANAIGRGAKNLLGKFSKKGAAKLAAGAAAAYGAKKLADNVAGKAAGEGAETVAKEGAETIAKEGVETVAKEGTEIAAKKGAQTVATEGTEVAAKKGTEIAAKETAEQALIETAEKTSTKIAGTAGSAVSKELVETAAITTAAVTAKEAAEKGLEKGLVTGLKAKIAAAIAAKVPKAFAGALGKSVPFLGAAIGGAFAIPKLLSGDFVGASMEAGSGLGSAVTAIPLTVASVARDVYKEVYDVQPEQDPLAGERFKEIKDGVMDAANNFLSKEKKPETTPPAEPSLDSAPSIVPAPIKEATAPKPADASSYSETNLKQTETKQQNSNSEISPEVSQVAELANNQQKTEQQNSGVEVKPKALGIETFGKQKEKQQEWIKKGYRTLNDIPKEEQDSYIKEFSPKSLPPAFAKQALLKQLSIELTAQGAKADTGSNNNLIERNIETGEVKTTPAITPTPIKEAVNGNTVEKPIESPVIITPPITKQSVTPKPDVENLTPTTNQTTKPELQNTTLPKTVQSKETANENVLAPSAKMEVLREFYKQENKVVAAPSTEIKTTPTSASGSNSNKTEGILERIANNTGGTTQNISNLIAGFNNLAKALERTLGESAKIPLVVNTSNGENSQSLPTSFYANAGNSSIGSFRTFVEGARSLPA